MAKGSSIVSYVASVVLTAKLPIEQIESNILQL